MLDKTLKVLKPEQLKKLEDNSWKLNDTAAGDQKTHERYGVCCPGSSCGLRERIHEGVREATLRMFCVVRLAITPISRPSFCVGYSNHMNSIVAATKDDLKWELPHAARTMPIVDSNETFRIGLDAC